MKVAHVIQRYLPSDQLRGAERYMCAVSEKLAKKGFSITILTSKNITSNGFHSIIFNPFTKKIKKKIEEINGVDVVRFDTNYPLKILLHGIYFISRIIRINQLKELFFLLSYGPLLSPIYYHIKNSDYDIVHATPPIYVHTWLAWKAARKKKIPFVILSLYHFEMSTLHQKNRYVNKIIRNSDAVITCTNIEKKKLVETGVSQNKIHVVPLGIEPSDWKIQSGKRFRKKYSINKNDFVLLLPFKEYYKGATNTLKAVKLLSKYKKMVIIALGNTNEKSWREEVKKCEHIRIIEPGWINEDEKKDIFDGCDILVQPSIDESFGITYFEAWMCGKAVIGAKAGVMPEIIRDGIDGYLVKFGNTKELAEKIMYLYKNPKLRMDMGNNGKKKVLKEYTWDIVSKNLESIYNNIGLNR
jgi:glycosyltransferase involved in cell wall biosynthesis|tara:strand:- start:13113 stop:14351 length:1239 start_codon:yes stop_codon:yes gene_type:complete